MWDANDNLIAEEDERIRWWQYPLIAVYVLVSIVVTIGLFCVGLNVIMAVL